MSRNKSGMRKRGLDFGLKLRQNLRSGHKWSRPVIPPATIKCSDGSELTMSRAEAERAVTDFPELRETLMQHPNYHVRRRAWTAMGRPIPASNDDGQMDTEECKKLAQAICPNGLKHAGEGVRWLVMVLALVEAS